MRYGARWAYRWAYRTLKLYIAFRALTQTTQITKQTNRLTLIWVRFHFLHVTEHSYDIGTTIRFHGRLPFFRGRAVCVVP